MARLNSSPLPTGSTSIRPPAGGNPPPRALRLSATHWPEFPITSIAQNGLLVKRGELMVRIDTTKLDLEISSLQLRLARNQKRLSQIGKENLQRSASSALQLEALLEEAVSTSEAQSYFRKHLHGAKKASATTAIHRTGQLLARQLQEYRMLFSIQRAKKASTSLFSRALEYHQGVMAASEFCLGMEVLNHRKILDQQLPREASHLASVAEDARRRYAVALEKHSQAIHAAQLSHQLRETRLWQDGETLAALEKDRSLCVLHAPADGWLHHASQPGDFLAAGKVFATFTPAGIV